jgi:hypothetical protein
MMKDELPGDHARYFDYDVVFHQSQHQVYGGGHSSRSPNASVFGEDAILLDVDLGKSLLQPAGMLPMRSSPPPVENARFH